jgi:hypothetical protein
MSAEKRTFATGSIGSIVLKNSLRKFELVRSEKIRQRQSLSVDLNVQICTEPNCHGHRDRKFGRPFVKEEFFNRIGQEQIIQTPSGMLRNLPIRLDAADLRQLLAPAGSNERPTRRQPQFCQMPDY